LQHCARSTKPMPIDIPLEMTDGSALSSRAMLPISKRKRLAFNSFAGLLPMGQFEYDCAH